MAFYRSTLLIQVTIAGHRVEFEVYVTDKGLAWQWY